MKIAFITLPDPEDLSVAPPLPIAYLAALLELQRHIVRIYDFALSDTPHTAEALAPLRAFRPHIVVVAHHRHTSIAPIESALADMPTVVLPLGISLRSAAPGQAVAQALWVIERPTSPADEQSVIYEALLGLDDDLDTLPFPARHLLQLEQYPLFTPMGDLQTPLLMVQQFGGDSMVPRNPALITAELRSVAREYGIRHFILAGPPLSTATPWLPDLLYHLTTADLGVSWQSDVQYDRMSPELLRMFRRAGCEALCLPLDAGNLLGSKGARAELTQLVEQAHELDMAVRAQIQLNPSFAAMPLLVDLAATFGLDDVRFNMPHTARAGQPANGTPPGFEHITEMVQSRYRTSLSRQFFIERFGPRMGPMLWRVGRAGLLGRTWQRYADGNDETGQPISRGVSAA